ncbi:hypothetical protein G7077_02755 [Sphingomonas piscis]|uniref:Uncharacterized protein n=1 Tax=Sphingomonas piscis TaxID=2714943 RepID=A0A6G7YML6_9SPHN|nr:hypothetical protein [Sphingomonas piscis]QIK77990.1 hypothetical protein G7077_02755 [Sphingomonas piscis]
MIQLIYLQPGERMPHLSDDEPWLTVEASADGRFLGSGYGFKPSGEGVLYVSLPESDVSIEAALAAATEWAGEQGVPHIWVRTSPD